MPFALPAGSRTAIAVALLLCATAARAAVPPPHPPEIAQIELARAEAPLEAAHAQVPGLARTETRLPPLTPPREETVPLPPADADGMWSLVPPPFGRYGHSVTYDPRRRQLVLFSGSGQIMFDDLWLLKLDGGPAWHGHTPPEPRPSARQGHRVVYDAGRDRMILYGGYNNGSYFDDVWELRLDGEPRWRMLGVGPSARAYAAMVFDDVSGSVIIHGGFDGETRGDLWRLEFPGDGVVATEMAVEGPSPSPRTQHTAVFDPAGRVLVYGGQSDAIFEDTWILKLDPVPSWSQLETESSPGPRYGHGAVYDPRLGRVVLVGGFDHLNQYLADTWSFDFASERWEAFLLNQRPPGRVYADLAFDPEAGRVVMFGGFSPAQSMLGDLWSLDLNGVPSWSWLLAGASPVPRRHQAIAFDPARERLVLYGGQSPTSTAVYTDAWFLSGRDPAQWAWWAVPPAIGGRAFHSAIVDPVRDRLVVFGGFAGAVFNDVWALPLSGDRPWTAIRPQGDEPFSRIDHAAVYDPLRDRMIVVGGLLGTYMNDTWALDFSDPPTWTALAPQGLISGRRNHAMVYDSRRDRVLVFGGEFSGIPRTDVWALWLDPLRWERLRPDGEVPPGTLSPCGVYDPVRDRFVILQPGPSGSDRAELWALSLTGTLRWRRLEPIGVPPANGTFPVATYDPGGDRMLVQPGIVDGTPDMRVWALRFHPVWGARTAEPDAAMPPGGEVHASPNPARDRITLSAAGEPGGTVTLQVIDLAGRTIRRFDEVGLAAHVVREWDLRDRNGVRVAPGIYLAVAESGGRRIARRIAVLE